MTAIRFELPIRTVNESNESQQGQWWKRSRRRKRFNTAVHAKWPRAVIEPLLVVTMTRVSAGTLDDDGLRSALKSIRDGIASKLKVDDASPLVRWVYHQERGPRGEHLVRVEIREAVQATIPDPTVSP